MVSIQVGIFHLKLSSEESNHPNLIRHETDLSRRCLSASTGVFAELEVEVLGKDGGGVLNDKTTR